MGKKRYVYNLFSAAQLKARADVPTAANITVVDDTVDYIDCVNISQYQIADLLVLDRDTGIIGLCRATEVNRWSCWCPVVRSYSGSGWTRDLVNGIPTLCRQLDFAGYNHNALVPGWQTGGQATAQADKWVDYGSEATIECPICIGELDWVADLDAGWVIAVIFNAEDGVAGWSKVDITTVANNFTISPETTDEMLLDHTDWYGRFVICDSVEIASVEDVESAILCRVPNTSTFEVNIKIKLPSEVYYADTEDDEPPSPWVNNDGPLGMNWTTGIVTIGYDLQTNNTYVNVQFQATLYNWLNEVIGQGDIFNDAYNPLDSVSGSVDLGMASIPAFGYRVVVEIFYTL